MKSLLQDMESKSYRFDRVQRIFLVNFFVRCSFINSDFHQKNQKRNIIATYIISSINSIRSFIIYFFLSLPIQNRLLQSYFSPSHHHQSIQMEEKTHNFKEHTDQPFLHELLPQQNQNPPLDYNYEYFKEMVSIRNHRKLIQLKMEELNKKRHKIYEKVVFYEKKTEEQFKDYIRGEAPQRKKRSRRNADEIDREYNCPICHKKYGSEGSMHQHIKLKHPDSYEPKKRNSKTQKQISSYSQQSGSQED